MNFEIKAFDVGSSARAGTITTDHGDIQTPIFMPVGTIGTVKGVHQHELRQKIDADIILSNTYHLYLRPGTDILKSAGGIHQFIGWDRPMLTDSGGYQVYSLSSQRKIKEDGAHFKSHIDGSKHLFTPENVMRIQRDIGADFIMAFDECTPYPCEKQYAENSLALTNRWLDRCRIAFDNSEALYGYQQELLPIVQGSTYADLRRKSCDYILRNEWFGHAIGGLSVGEPHEEMYRITELCCGILPKEKPRYLMGVGTPANLLECIGLGIDMFDCVLPTRNARHGLLYTSNGIINIKNAKWEKDLSPIDANLECDTSRNHSKAYLRHLFKSNELLGPQIASLHNLHFFLWLMRMSRDQIINGTFYSWKDSIIKRLQNRL
ncbi:MAG: tRNA guanosine(34) transglycosylase Tgt [Bacteroidia bacterium]|nr:tRNA guanosine(34) transglycosylase Tgt [Bacteroidia bacterium]